LSFGATSLMVRSHIFAEDVFICVYMCLYFSILVNPPFGEYTKQV
jgi:hypothetical protein